MKRDNELIRHLLLLIEDQGDDMNDWIEDVIIEGYSENQISHHIWLLTDGGYVESIDCSDFGETCWKPRCLTWSGHEFLDAIRSRDIWTKTLSLANKGGVESLAALAEIAKTLLKKKVERLLDIAS